MFSIYARNGNESRCIYNDVLMSDEIKLSSPKLTLSENNAGQFEAKLAPTNAGYDFVERLISEIIINRQNEEIWVGRVITIKEDFYKNKVITCEGELAYLNDTIQPQEGYNETNTDYIFMSILNYHNQNVEDKKKFNLGYSTEVHEVEETYTNYESTLEAINNLIIKPFGGILNITKRNGVKQLNYMSEDDRVTSSQVINFGSNLLDFTKTFDSTDFCTVILPLGKRIEDKYGVNPSGIEGVEAYTTVDDVNGGSPYVGNTETINTFGRIEKIVKFDGIDDEEELLDFARKYLAEVQFDNMVLEVSAVDLAYLNVDVNYIHLSENVRVISPPHGLDRLFPVTKISIPLDNPGNTTFTMGTNVSNALSTKSIQGVEGIKKKIEELPTESEILNNAKRRADALIDAFTTGYITITTDEHGSNELYVTDEKITTKRDVELYCNSYWRWNQYGLGYYNKNKANFNNPNGLKLALTMDGAIVADFITAGTLDAERIRAGILQGYYNHDNWWNLTTGELHISSSAKYGDNGETLGTKFSITNGKIESEITRATGAEGTLSSRITQTAESITTEVTRATTAEGTLSSRITQTADSITSEVTRATNAESTLSSRITQTADSITSEVTRATRAESNLSSRITQTAEEIELKVSADDVHSIIRQDAHSIRMMSDTLVVDSNNFSLTEDGHLTCYGADIRGKLRTEQDDGSYMVMEYNRLTGSSGCFVELNNETDYNWSCMELNANYVCFSSNGVYLAEGQGSGNVKRAFTGTIKVYTYIGTGSQRREKYFHFKNGILYSIDETANDGFVPKPEGSD